MSKIEILHSNFVLIKPKYVTTWGRKLCATFWCFPVKIDRYIQSQFRS